MLSVPSVQSRGRSSQTASQNHRVLALAKDLRVRWSVSNSAASMWRMALSSARAHAGTSLISSM